MTDFHTYSPGSPNGLLHDPFNAIIGPRPIGWISSVSSSGSVNLAPYSFFNAFNYKPPIIGFASIGWKDTVRNIQETGEFVWNLVTRELVEAMNISCAPFPSEINEFDAANLQTLPSETVKPPRVADSPVQFECRLTQCIQLQNHHGDQISTWLVLGEVVRVHIHRKMVKASIYQPLAARTVLRAGGPGGYVEIHPDAVFTLLRPNSIEDIQPSSIPPSE